MPLPLEPIFEYVVCYRIDPKYDGDFNRLIRPGIHGKFRVREEAEEAAKKCLAFLSEEKTLKNGMTPEGQVTKEILVTKHKNAIVWIDEYKDGNLVKDGQKAAA